MMLTNKEDGRLVLYYNNKHIFLNTPNYPKNFHGENIFEILEDYCLWLKNQAAKLHWLDDTEEGVSIDLTDND